MNRLVTATTSAGSATLHYDPFGRLSRTIGAADTRFAYDGLNLIAEYGGSGSVLKRYVHGPGTDKPIVWYEGAGTADRPLKALLIELIQLSPEDSGVPTTVPGR